MIHAIYIYLIIGAIHSGKLAPGVVEACDIGGWLDLVIYTLATGVIIAWWPFLWMAWMADWLQFKISTKKALKEATR